MKIKILIPILAISALITTGLLVSFYMVYSTTKSSEDPYDYLGLQSKGTTEDLLLHVDVSDVIIGYNTTPMDDKVNIQIASNNMIGIPMVSYKTEDRESVIIPVETDIVKIQLRSDLKYNLNVIAPNGSIFLNVPENVSLGNIQFSTVSGNIITRFSRNNEINDLTLLSIEGNIKTDMVESLISGDIAIATVSGIISSSLCNITYQNDSKLDIFGESGTILLDIDQNDAMNADVAGNIQMGFGSILIDYSDTSENVSAYFSSFSWDGIADYYTSPNYPAEYNYQLYCFANKGNILIYVNE